MSWNKNDRIPKEEMQKIQSKATKAAALKMQERKNSGIVNILSRILSRDICPRLYLLLQSL